MRKNEKGFSAVEGLLIFAAVALIGLAGWYIWQNKSSRRPLNQSSQQSSVQNNNLPTKDESEVTEYGTIAGNASFPSGGLADDEAVCAVNIRDDKKIYCDKEVGSRYAKQDKCALGEVDCNKPAPDTSYSIKVPAGEYYVYSTAESRKPGYKAYYNEYTKCGLSVECPEAGHKQYISVTVKANETISNIDPADWYADWLVWFLYLI